MHAKLIMRQNYCVLRRINNWNSPSNDIVCASSYAMFKRKLVVFTNFMIRGNAFNAS